MQEEITKKQVDKIISELDFITLEIHEQTPFYTCSQMEEQLIEGSRFDIECKVQLSQDIETREADNDSPKEINVIKDKPYCQINSLWDNSTELIVTIATKHLLLLEKEIENKLTF